MEMNPQPDPDQAQSDQLSIMSQNCLDSKYDKTVENMLVAMIWLKKPVWMSIKESECKECSFITWQDLQPNGKHSFAVPQNLQVA